MEVTKWLKPSIGQRVYSLEDRVSGAIRNPKDLRRSIGLQSMGATPTMNR
jgi:hypothetical protein